VNEHQAAGCESKQGFETKAMAEKVRREMMRRHNTKLALKVYRCSYCGLWHIGTSHKRRKK